MSFLVENFWQLQLSRFKQFANLNSCATVNVPQHDNTQNVRNAKVHRTFMVLTIDKKPKNFDFSNLTWTAILS